MSHAQTATRQRPPVGPWRLIRRLVLLLVGAALLGLLAEWGLRATNLERLSYTNPALYQADEVLGYRMRPDVRVYSHGAWFETNRAGLRGAHWEEVHGEGRECVLFLGHSIIGGFGVTAEQAIPGVFSRVNRSGLVGINLGHCAYRYWQEFPLAHEHLEEIRPVATVVMFTANEFEPQYDPFASSNIDGGEIGARAVPLPGKTWLRRNSALYTYLRKSWNRLLIVLGEREIPIHFEYESIKGLNETSRRHFAAYEAQLWQLKTASAAPLILTAFPMGQSAESYAILEDMARRVGARWVSFEDLFESPADYRLHGALAWSEHPNAETQHRMALRLTAAVEESLASLETR